MVRDIFKSSICLLNNYQFTPRAALQNFANGKMKDYLKCLRRSWVITRERQI